MTVLCIISLFFSHTGSTMTSGASKARLIDGAPANLASLASIDALSKPVQEVTIAIAPAAPAGTAGAGDDESKQSEIELAELTGSFDEFSISPAVRKRSDSMTPNHERLFRLMHVIDCPDDKSLEETKYLVMVCGIDDDFYRRANICTTYPESKSPFWHVLTLLVQDTDESGVKYKARFELAHILAGVAPESRKRPIIDGWVLHFVVKHDRKALVTFLLDHKICRPNTYNVDKIGDCERHSALFDATTFDMIELLISKGVVPLFAGELRPEKMGYYKLVRNGRSWEVARDAKVSEIKEALSASDEKYMLPDGVSVQAEFRSLLVETLTGGELYRRRNYSELITLLAYHRQAIKTLVQFPDKEHGERYDLKVGPLKFIAQYADVAQADDLLRHLLSQDFIWCEEDDLLDASCEKLVGVARKELIDSASYKKITGNCCCRKSRCSLLKQCCGACFTIVVLIFTATEIIRKYS